ncbi:hypothetical protein [Pseudonocardia sp. WMMC193]|uniref:hypothetical protein n=1 Tax=Pseudonocardia sp. WMMC193 TaxID=2911965 RepID=UPI001F388EC1|nr:hypothetical protein [Pseudonocardia sp. WMMC193]MCF7548096.1 hypothetical protein [Pseudonocardia sp. WMMC193]
MGGPFARGPREHSDEPLPGFKLAYPMLAADGRACGFSGVTLGRAHVYRAVDDALCAHGSRHACPSRWCDCGFYCFHDIAAARDLACEPDHRNAVLLEIAASGRYRRYERGLRYARQRVTAVRIGRCECGRAAGQLADSGAGTVGWRKLLPVCARCGAGRPTLDPARFGELAQVSRVLLDGPPVEAPAATPPAEDPGTVALLSAEIAVLHARLDEALTRLDALESRQNGR